MVIFLAETSVIALELTQTLKNISSGAPGYLKVLIFFILVVPCLKQDVQLLKNTWHYRLDTFGTNADKMKTTLCSLKTALSLRGDILVKYDKVRSEIFE